MVLSSIIFMATIFYYGVQKLAELENMMISTERVIEYGNLPAEAALESSKGNTLLIFMNELFMNGEKKSRPESTTQLAFRGKCSI